jgi:predicted nucleotidyltransferase
VDGRVSISTGYGRGYCNINGRPVGLHGPYRNPWPGALPIWWKNTSALCGIAWWEIATCTAWWEMRSLLSPLPPPGNCTIFVQRNSMQLNKETILQRLRAIKPDLQEKYNLTELALFGSYARDEQTAQSDIDIMVKMSTPDFRNYSNIYHVLEEVFPGTVVQVVSRGAIQPKYFKYVEPDLLYA